MSEKRILTAKCPSCGTTLQVKTRSVEKTIACPKCQASVTASAAAGAAPEGLPFAALVEEPKPALPMAEPLSALPMAEPLTLPFAQPLATSPRCSPKQLAIAGGIGGAVLVAALLLIIFLPGAGQQQTPSSPSVSGNKGQTGGSAAEPVASQETSVASQPQENGQPDADGAVQGESEPAIAEQGLSKPKVKQKQGPNNSANVGGNYFDALSKAKIKQGLNNPANAVGNNFPPGGLQNLNPTPRDQQRDWDLANSGRLGAMGLKKVQVPRK